MYAIWTAVRGADGPDSGQIAAGGRHHSHAAQQPGPQVERADPTSHR